MLNQLQQYFMNVSSGVIDKLFETRLNNQKGIVMPLFKGIIPTMDINSARDLVDVAQDTVAGAGDPYDPLTNDEVNELWEIISINGYVTGATCSNIQISIEGSIHTLSSPAANQFSWQASADLQWVLNKDDFVRLDFSAAPAGNVQYQIIYKRHYREALT